MGCFWCFECFCCSERSEQSPKPYDNHTYSNDGGDVTSNVGGGGGEEEEEEEVEQQSPSKRSDTSSNDGGDVTSNSGGEEEEEVEKQSDSKRSDTYSNDGGDVTSNSGGEEEEEVEKQSDSKRSEEILKHKLQYGLICRQFPVKETNKLIRGEDEDGNKTINEFVRQRKIACGSYGKVVLYQSTVDGKEYAIKAFHKSVLLRQHVAPSETAMGDVLREVMIMKILEHPNVVNLVEVIDDPETDHFYMVLEYVDGNWAYDHSGPPGALGENTARKYLRDVVAGLMYIHSHNVVHGDIKPDNLLVSSTGTVKIGDFGVSQVFKDDDDQLRRSPGTPVFTAPECCLGTTYSGRAADTWAVGVTLYRSILGQYPFLGDTVQDVYDKIVHNSLIIPDGLNPHLKDLIEGLLCKDPNQRMTLKAVAEHPWVTGEDGAVPEYFCWCKRKAQEEEEKQKHLVEPKP